MTQIERELAAIRWTDEQRRIFKKCMEDATYESVPPRCFPSCEATRHWRWLHARLLAHREPEVCLWSNGLPVAIILAWAVDKDRALTTTATTDPRADVHAEVVARRAGKRPAKLDPFLARLGREPDDVIATLAGVIPKTVQVFRERRGIAPFQAAA